MRTITIAIACCLSLTAVSAAAADRSSKDHNDQQSNGQKIECRIAYHEGMLIRSKSMCQPAVYWRNERFRTQEMIENMQIRALTTNPR